MLTGVSFEPTQAMINEPTHSGAAVSPPRLNQGLIQRLFVALLACIATAAVAHAARHVLEAANIVMLFLLTVAVVAAKLGQLPAILAAFMSVAAFDFLFVPPYFSFAINDVQYLVTFAVMLVVALLIGTLTTGLQRSAAAAQHGERQTLALYSLARALSGAASIEQMLEAIEGYFDTHFRRSFHILVPDASESLHVLGAPRRVLVNTELLAARTVFLSGKRVESGDLGGDPKLTLILPMNGAIRSRGVLIIDGLGMSDPSLQERRPLLEAVASLIATALERLHFVAVAQQSQLETAAERLRSSILSALSHDVRTPLTTLYGLADSLLLDADSMSDTARESLETIREQALRLHHMVANLLDMARLQAGSVQLKKEWQPVEEVIGASIKLLEPTLAGHSVSVRIARDLPLLELDAVLLERVFCNLLENAAKYAAPSGAIEISAELAADHAVMWVRNEGQGFSEDRLSSVFELFARGEHESTIAGVGMGLAICKAIVEAHGGTIAAVNVPAGADVRFTLPLGCPPIIEPDPEDATTAV